MTWQTKWRRCTRVAEVYDANARRPVLSTAKCAHVPIRKPHCTKADYLPVRQQCDVVGVDLDLWEMLAVHALHNIVEELGPGRLFLGCCAPDDDEVLDGRPDLLIAAPQLGKVLPAIRHLEEGGGGRERRFVLQVVEIIFMDSGGRKGMQNVCGIRARCGFTRVVSVRIWSRSSIPMRRKQDCRTKSAGFTVLQR